MSYSACIYDVSSTIHMHYYLPSSSILGTENIMSERSHLTIKNYQHFKMFTPGIWLLCLIETNKEEIWGASEMTSQKSFHLWEIKDQDFIGIKTLIKHRPKKVLNTAKKKARENCYVNHGHKAFRTSRQRKNNLHKMNLIHGRLKTMAIFPRFASYQAILLFF